MKPETKANKPFNFAVATFRTITYEFERYHVPLFRGNQLTIWDYLFSSNPILKSEAFDTLKVLPHKTQKERFSKVMQTLQNAVNNQHFENISIDPRKEFDESYASDKDASTFLYLLTLGASAKDNVFYERTRQFFLIQLSELAEKLKRPCSTLTLSDITREILNGKFKLDLPA